MSIHIGTSGRSYQHWEDVLYPPGTPPYERLPYYLQHFNTVALNSSFYRWPRVNTFKSWRRILPEGFLMIVKAPRGLTHAKKLYGPEKWLQTIQAGWHALLDKRGIFLVQLSPLMEYDYDRLAYFLDKIPWWMRTAVEFRHPRWQLEQWFALLMVATLVFVIVLLSFSPLRFLRAPKKVALILMLLFFTLIQLAVIFNLLIPHALELLFVFLFFLTNTGIGVYFIYAGDFPQPAHEAQAGMSFSGFVEKYGITAREEEIILEIYKGKTNREIADELFVTVQTIKDHTHRIYQKTEVKNRTQLASLLRAFENL